MTGGCGCDWLCRKEGAGSEVLVVGRTSVLACSAMLYLHP